MRFSQIDRITELHAGQSVTAIKVLTLAEEYLADHFPRFPVMPGVLMLEAMYQASAWLVRYSEDFAHAAVLLRETRNAKFSNFVLPGQVLVVQAHIVKQDETTTSIKAEASVADKTAVTARLVLERYNLSDRFPSRAATDALAIRTLRRQFELLYSPPEVSVDL